MQPYRAWNTSIATQIRAWESGPGDRYLAAAPITHGTSTYILPTLGTGGTIVLFDRPRPEETLHCLQHEAITTTFVPPTVIYMMMQRAESRASDYRHLRNLIYGSAPMRSEAIAEAQSIFGPCVASTYGQTEAPQIATMIASQDLARPEKRASVGRETFLTRVGIMRPDGTLADIGDEGEIVIRGDLLMSGYWRQPEDRADDCRWLAAHRRSRRLRRRGLPLHQGTRPRRHHHGRLQRVSDRRRAGHGRAPRRRGLRHLRRAGREVG